MNSDGRSGAGTRVPARRGLVLIGLIAAAAVLTAGCDVGLQAQTTMAVPDVAGVDGQANVVGANGVTIGTVAVRNVFVPFKDAAGYPQGGAAPLEAWIFNNTPNPVTAVVSSADATSVTFAPGAGAVTPAASPTAPAGAPASLTIPASGFAVLNPQQARYFQLTGLTKPLPVGSSVPVTFDFGGGVTIKLEVPMGSPSTPLPPPTPIDLTPTGQ